MQAVEWELEDQHSYDRLMVALEASQGKLDLLIAVCDDLNLQETVIQTYIAELQQQGIAHYRVFIQRQDPRLRYTLQQLVQQQPELQQEGSGVVTVQGLNDLLGVRLGAATSEQERLLGYLQWTREALREFNFPVVIWVNSALLAQLAEKAPDFWSWRGGVFWFVGKAGLPEPIESPASHLPKSPAKPLDPELANLLTRIEAMEQQQGRDAPQLAELYEQLGQVYAQRFHSSSNRQFAIQAYRRSIQLQRRLGSKAELAESLKRLGDLYFELQDNVNQAAEAYQEALDLYREVGDRIGEANTLQAISDVLQFLKRSNEALSNYEQAIGLYREVGDRIGEANVLQEFGKLQEDRSAGLDYLQQAQTIYQQTGDQYSQSRNLLFMADCYVQLQQTDAAIEALQQAAELASRIGFEPLQQYALNKIAELQ
ncbi:tetratricopeptide repeat protein [Egbenema bharatensis]|uniref:tetratricopeptide repeat protein n=1 Tax=Egbenema bharatensis TaxID=3463334 RepID=UPI003A8A6847